MDNASKYVGRNTPLGTLLISCAVCLSAGFAAHAETDAARSTYEMRPVMSTAANEITACGVALELKTAKTSFELILSNEKSSEGKLTRLSVRGLGKDQPGEIAVLENALLETADCSTANSLQNIASKKPGSFQAQKIGDDHQFGGLFQQLLVGGARVTIATANDQHVWTISGPASQSIRSAYLMCAGDLYRPASESVRKSSQTSP